MTIICIHNGGYSASLTQGKHYAVISSHTWLGQRKFLIEDNLGLKRWYDAVHFEVKTPDSFVPDILRT